MAESSKWGDVKARARVIDPTWDSPERVERRAGMREQMIAAVSGAGPTSLAWAGTSTSWPGS